MRKQPSITTLPPSPEQERHTRMLKYTVAMGIRMACILLCFVVPWPWLLIPVLGAVFLPYVAVVIANAKRVAGGEGEVLRPGGLLPYSPPDAPPAAPGPAEEPPRA